MPADPHRDARANLRFSIILSLYIGCLALREGDEIKLRDLLLEHEPLSFNGFTRRLGTITDYFVRYGDTLIKDLDLSFCR